MIAPTYQSAAGDSHLTDRATRSPSPRERTAPVAPTVQPSPPKPRPHHGTTAQQFDALERLATDTAERVTDTAGHVRAIQLALRVHGILPDPASEPQRQTAPWPPEGYPPSPKMVRRHGLRLVKS
jgi:hypothetical protein